MADGFIKAIEDLGKEGLEFLEKEIEAIEGEGGKKSVYPSTFKGEVLEKHDPYDEDKGDHEAHGAETEVPAPNQDAQWFPAVKKAGVSKTSAVASPGAGTREAQKASGTEATKATVGGGTRGNNKDAATDPNNLNAANLKVDPFSGGKANAAVLAVDAHGGLRNAAGVEAGKGVASGGGAGSTAAAKRVGSVKADDGSSPNQDDKGKGIGGTKRTSDSKASASDLKHNDANNAQDDDGANTPDSDRRSKRNNTSVSSRDKGSSGSKRSDPNQSDPDADADNPSDAGNANTASSSGSRTKKPRGATANQGDDAQDQEGSEDDNASVEDAADEAAADGDDQEESPTDDSASTVFDKKAPSLIADLDDFAAKGKKAKVKKETLRGARRTLEEPHKLFKDPARLAAARSGDPETVKHSLKRHGRAIVPLDDADPHDISADRDKLEAVRSNPNKAIRGVIDMGQQYGMDPFDGVDPADVQNIIEHHAAEHPHRKHKVPYVPPETSDDVTSDDNDDNANVDSAEDNNGVSRSRVNKRKKTKQRDGGDSDLEDASAVADASTNDEDEDNEEDNNAGSEDGEDAEPPKYPKLDDAADLDPDDPDNDLSPRKKNNKKKRSYPKPYCNNDDPSDLQLACDSLSTMAADADDSDANDDENDDDSDDAPLRKRKALAAKKMLKCLNRVRSYQQDPAACEGAFVDEASDEDAEVAGLSPDEIEEHYYALKEVSKKYKALSDPKDDDEEDNDSDDSDVSNDDNDPDDDSDDSDYVPNDDNDADNKDDRSTHKKKKSNSKIMHGHHASHKHPEHNKHHKKTQHTSSSHRHERYIDSEDSNPYNANFIRNQVDTDAQYETPDIEMSLPENQFSGQTTRSNSGGAATYDSTLQGSDPSMAGLTQDPETGIYYYQDPTTGEYYIVDPITGEYSPVDSSQSEDDQADPSAGDSADPMNQLMGVAMGLMGGSDDDDTDPTAQMTGLLTGLMSNPDEVTALARELSSTEKSAKSLDGAIRTISKTEKELVAVESAGSKAASASSKIKRLKGAKANYSKMINLCSNPIDNVIEAENALSMVNELAQNPDAVINQADALINVAQQGVSALASAKSPEDAMTVMMGMAAQMSSGSGDDDSEDDDSEAEIDPDTGLAIDPTTGLEFDPTSGLAYDPVTGAMIDPNTGAPVDPYQVQSQQGNYTNAQGVPAEFENEGMYGDE